MEHSDQTHQQNGEVAPPMPPPQAMGQQMPPQQPMAPMQNASLYVGDLHPDVTEAQLYEIFSAMGHVVSVKVCRDASTRRSLGYAYVNFNAAAEAEKAIEALNYTQIKGRPCRIMWSQRDPSLRKTGEGNVFVKHLDLSIDNKALYDTFSLFGNILSCKVSTDEHGRSRGYGFVHFETKEAADEAIEKINGMLLAGKEVYVGKFLKRNDRPGGKDWTNIYIKNLPLTWSKEDLEKEFSKFGEVLSAVIMEDDDGKSKGFGFIDYADHEAAEKAVEEMNGKDVRDAEMKKAAEESEKVEKEEKEAADDDASSKGEEGVLFVGKAQKKSERERDLAKKFEELKLEKQSKFDGVNLYVKNLDDSVDDDMLQKEFEVFGDITSAKVMTDKDGVSKGFGFVCFSSSDEAVKAVNEMNGKLVVGKPLYVAVAQRKDQRKQQLEAQHRRMMTMPPQMYPYGPAQIPQMGMHSQHMGNMMGQPQPMMRQPQPMMRESQFQFNRQARNMPMMSDPPLTAEALAGASQSQRKDMIGQKLYPQVMQIQPQFAAKITGMLLEMDNQELLHLLESPQALISKVAEAVDVLQKATYREALMK